MSKTLMNASLLLGITLAITACDYESSATPEITACTYARMEVETLLKSPSSAKFPACSQMNISNVNDVYTVSSSVEAQNSFGATVQSAFTCEVTLNDDDSYYINCDM